jgi:hypothetical protein
LSCNTMNSATLSKSPPTTHMHWVFFCIYKLIMATDLL